MWKKRGKNTLESSGSNGTADNNCAKPKRWTHVLPEDSLWQGTGKPSPAGAWTLRNVPGTRSSIAASQPVPNESLLQDWPLNWGFWSGPGHLWCCLHHVPGAGNNLELVPYPQYLGPDYSSLTITFMGSFCTSLSGQDRADRSVPLKYLFSVSMLVSRAGVTEDVDKPTHQTNRQVAAWSSQVSYGCYPRLASPAGTRAPDEPRLRTSL